MSCFEMVTTLWRRRFHWMALIAMIGVVAVAARVRAELPLARLTAVFPAGGQAGATVEVTLSGQDLDEVTRLHFARPGITAKPKTTAAGVAEPGKFLVTIDAGVPAGLYDLRAIGRFGITNPRTFEVGAAPEITGKPGNTSTAAAIEVRLGLAIHAQADANAKQYFRVALEQGQRAFIEAATARIDSKLEAVIVVSDAAGRELAQSRHGAPVEVTAASDGNYFVAVHDVLYRGGPEYFYRLAVSGEPASQPAGSLRWPVPSAAAFLFPSTLPVATPSESGSTRRIEPPCEILGEFRSARARDWYTFDAAVGTVYWIEVTCHRLGEPAAPFLLVQRVGKDGKATDVQEVYEAPAAGAAPEFSTASRDPIYRLEVKEAGTYRLLVRNLFQAPPEQGPIPYRVSIRRESPDFSLVAVPASPMPEPKDSKDVPVWSTLLRRGGVTPITVAVNRRDGFAGDVHLSVTGLPRGVTAGPAVVAPGANSGTILLVAADDAPAWAGAIRVIGDAMIGRKPVIRVARAGTVAGSAYDGNTKQAVVRSRLSDEFMIAVSGVEQSPLAMAATQPAWDATVGGKVSLALKITRRAEFNGPITYRLAGHPLLAAAPKEFSVDAKADTGGAELDLNQVKLPAGRYVLHVEGQGKVKYANNPEAAKAAQTLAEQAVKHAAEQAAATKAADAAVVEAGKGKDAAVKTAAEQAAAEAKRKLAAVEAEKVAAEARAKELAAKAQPKELTASFYSTPFVVNVAPAPVAKGK
jgi:hypothetical protein